MGTCQFAKRQTTLSRGVLRNFRNATVARSLSVQYVVERDTQWKATGALDYKPVAVLANKHIAAQLIISMAHGVQDSLSDNTLVEC